MGAPRAGGLPPGAKSGRSTDEHQYHRRGALILLREGAEAILVVGALAAYLHRIGQGDRTRLLYWGAGAALAASLVLANLFHRFLDGNHDDLTEAVTMLAAAAVLLYVSGWMFARRNAARWLGYLADHAGRAAATGGAWALAAASFLAVFREGAETVLFLNAVALEGGGWDASMVAGIGLGAGGLVLLYLAMRGIAGRIPIGPLFTATSALLFLLALRFVGLGLLELQELGALPYSAIDLPEWLAAAGVSPTAEGLAAQAAIAAGLLGTAARLWLKDRRRQRPAAGAAAE